MTEPPFAVAFPRTATYDPDWVRENALGENPLCQAELLARHLPFHEGDRVLDLGCGRAATSIFLAREFGVQVWAADREVSPTDNFLRAAECGVGDRVFPLRLDARDLPFPEGFFDAVVAIDSWLYYGTDERYLSYLAPFLKPAGWLGVVDVALLHEVASPELAPPCLGSEYEEHWSYVHSLAWWRQHWEKTGLVDVVHGAYLAESGRLLREYAQWREPGREVDPIMRAVMRDDDGVVSLFSLVGRKREG
ncbi:cyclopropane-fatty-acyl-phospholipid synthase family protein [Geothrix sp. 21YS21S-4]|uniref:SAM-dependent methyltransferase n=1 Tax=Geothrix sp. 21YS21S-4 TaxID=3068889 RepID=UPI0027B91277|nr:methyltransferase domain-containing protein [Geothrix sp. 21YS21S-4]